MLFFGIFKDALWVTLTLTFIGVQAMLEFLWILVYCVVLSAIYRCTNQYNGITVVLTILPLY